MTRFLALTVLAVTGLAADAQFIYPPYGGYQPYVLQRGPNLGGIQYLGNVGNIPVFNPWNMYNNQNYSGYLYAQPVYPRYPRRFIPYFYPPAYNYNFGPYGAYNSGLLGNVNGVVLAPGLEREAGRFIPVDPVTAINNVTGTVLKPGVAYTNEGPFYQVPGSGSITAWGAFDPASGTYYNPVSGDLYNPGTGLINRR